MPFAPSSPLSLFGLNAQQQAATQSVSTVTPASKPAAVVNTTSINNTKTTSAAAGAQQQAVSPAVPAATKTMPKKAAPAIYFGLNYETTAFIWILGASALLFYFFAVNLTMRIIFSRRERCSDRTVTAALEDCRARLKLRAPVGVVYDDCAKSPGVFGLVRQKLLFQNRSPVSLTAPSSAIFLCTNSLI
jgi:beta-lactamase regulating signal transducer with metallopeptidase domain